MWRVPLGIASRTRDLCRMNRDDSAPLSVSFRPAPRVHMPLPRYASSASPGHRVPHGHREARKPQGWLGHLEGMSTSTALARVQRADRPLVNGGRAQDRVSVFELPPCAAKSQYISLIVGFVSYGWLPLGGSQSYAW